LKLESEIEHREPEPDTVETGQATHVKPGHRAPDAKAENR